MSMREKIAREVRPVACADCPFRSTTAARIDSSFGEDGFGDVMIELAKDAIRKGGVWHCHKTLGDDAEITADTRECWGSPRYRRALPLLRAQFSKAAENMQKLFSGTLS